MTFEATYKQPELVIGLVAPTGTDLERVVELLREQLMAFQYVTEKIRLSDLLDLLGEEVLGVPLVTDRKQEFERIQTHMNGGDALRRKTGLGEILAMYAVSAISQKRANLNEHVAGKAYLLHSLKTPDEVAALRRIYGPGFFLLGVHCAEAERVKYFKERKHLTDEQIKKLMARDEDDTDNEFGQRTRDTFHLADAFVTVDEKLSDRLKRLVRLLFGDPYASPTADEHAMFLAFASALRSADLSRQVGAALFDPRGDLISTGANDVPTFGGGQYWPGDGDQRDHVLKKDSNKEQIAELVEDTLKRLYGPDADLAQLNAKLKGGLIFDITEYGRAVHAEMEALLGAARTARSPRDGVLYATTFPCHNCAKHIIGAGVSRVVYVEPYPKSHAYDLHKDALSLSGADGKVRFEPFIGIGPRRYFDLFSLTLGSGRRIKRNQDGKTLDWPNAGDASLRIHAVPITYLERERLAALAVAEEIDKLKGKP